MNFVRICAVHHKAKGCDSPNRDIPEVLNETKNNWRQRHAIRLNYAKSFSLARVKAVLIWDPFNARSRSTTTAHA
jgi:hypothetical protein